MTSMISLFYRLPQTALKIFTGRNLVGHALAIGLTVLIVTTSFDWAYYQATRGAEVQQLARPAIHFGFVVPIWGSFCCWWRVCCGKIGGSSTRPGRSGRRRCSAG
jgi:hypothetical protein